LIALRNQHQFLTYNLLRKKTAYLYLIAVRGYVQKKQRRPHS
jgi:hypothetical protein